MPEPEAAPTFNEDGTFAPDWYKGYDEGHHETLKRFVGKNLGDFVNSHMEQRKQNGELGAKLGANPENVLIIPGEDADDATKEAYRAKLGVKDITEYQHVKDAGLKDDFIPNEEEMKLFAETARDLDMSPEKFNKFLNTYLGVMDKKKITFDAASEERQKKELADAEAASKKLLGDEFDSRRDRAENLFSKYSAMEVKDEKGEVVGTVKELLFEEFPGLKNSPNMLMVLDGIAGDMSEDRIAGLDGTSAPSSPASIDAALDALRDEEGYHDSSHSNYKNLMAKRKVLLEKRSAAV